MRVLCASESVGGLTSSFVVSSLCLIQYLFVLHVCLCIDLQRGEVGVHVRVDNSFNNFVDRFVCVQSLTLDDNFTHCPSNTFYFMSYLYYRFSIFFVI